jgi:hypothetical protein
MALALPPLTAEQRTQALVKATAARRARSEMLAALKTGQDTLDEVLARAEHDETEKKTKIAALLKALPGVGQKKTAALLDQAGILPARRAGGLGARQRRALLDALSD